MSDRASEGSVAESGFDAFADSFLHDEEVAPLQHVLEVTGPGWGPGARMGEVQPGGLENAVQAGAQPAPFCNSALMTGHQQDRCSPTPGTLLQASSSQVPGSFASLLESGPPGVGFYQALLSGNAPDLHWSGVHDGRLFQGLGPVKHLAFNPSSKPDFETRPPLMGGSEEWFQRPKQAGYGLAFESSVAPLLLPTRNPPGEATNNSWSNNGRIPQYMVPHGSTRQQLVAPRPGIATARCIEDTSALWQQRRHQDTPVHHGLSQATPYWIDSALRVAQPAVLQKDTSSRRGSARQPSQGQHAASGALTGHHHFASPALGFQGHPPQVPLCQPFRDQADHLSRNNLVLNTAHRFGGGRSGRRWEQEENRQKNLQAATLRQLPRRTPSPPEPDRNQTQLQAPPRPPGLRLNALFQDSPATSGGLRQPNPPQKHRQPTASRPSSLEANLLGGQRQLLIQRDSHVMDKQSLAARSATPRPARDLHPNGCASFLLKHTAAEGQTRALAWGPVLQAHTDWYQSQQHGTQPPDSGVPDIVFRAAADLERPYATGPRRIQAQGQHVSPPLETPLTLMIRPPSENLPLHSPSSTHGSPEKAQQHPLGPGTPVTRALQTQLSSTQLLAHAQCAMAQQEGNHVGVNDLPKEVGGHAQLGPLPSMVPVDVVEASAEHVPSRATRQRGRGARRAVRKPSAPRGLEKAARHAVKIEAQSLSMDGIGHDWQGNVFERYAQVPPEGQEKLGGVEAPVEPAPFLAENEAFDRYPMGKFTQLSARFDAALGFENVDEFGQELVGVKKRLRDGFESETELEAYQAFAEALGGVSTGARSKIAYELEKQAVLLALEEGHALKRIKLTGVFSPPVVDPEATNLDKAASHQTQPASSKAMHEEAVGVPGEGAQSVTPRLVEDSVNELQTGRPELHDLGKQGPGEPSTVQLGASTLDPTFAEGAVDTFGQGQGINIQIEASGRLGGLPLNQPHLARNGAHTSDGARGGPNGSGPEPFPDVEDAMSDSEDKENIRPGGSAEVDEDEMDIEVEQGPFTPHEERSGDASPRLLTPAIGLRAAQGVANRALFQGGEGLEETVGGVCEVPVLLGGCSPCEDIDEDDPLLALQPAAKRHKADHRVSVESSAAAFFSPLPPLGALSSDWSIHASARSSLDRAPIPVQTPPTPPKSSLPSISTPPAHPLAVPSRRPSLSLQTPSPPTHKSAGMSLPKSSPNRMRPALCSAPYNSGSPTRTWEARGPTSPPRKTSPGGKKVPSPAKSHNSAASPPRRGSKGAAPSSSSSRSLGPSPPRRLPSSPAKMARMI